MAKNGVFKKITSLAMAIALVVCFAVSASAVTVSTTTTYVAGGEYIDVTVQVTDAGANNNVAYYATNSNGDVHIDQEKADGDGNATFNYRTEYANLATTSAKIGVTGASSAVDNDDTKVDGYTVTLVNGTSEDEKIVANEGELTVIFDYEAADGKVFDKVVVSGTETEVPATVDSEENTLTVTFTEITGDVTLTVVEKAAVTTTATAAIIERAAVVSTGKVDGVIGDVTNKDGEVIENADVQAAKGDVKLTVIGKATDASEYGILVSKSAISGYDANIAYEGMTILTEADTERGYAKDVFAVQIIDTSATGEILEAGGKCYVAVYAKDKVTNEYVVSAASEVEIPAAAAEEN